MAGAKVVIGNLEKQIAKQRRNGQIAGTMTAASLSSHAVKTRPWTDRTTKARNSIKGTSEVKLGTVTVALAIGVFYGKYLELSRFGRYSVIGPTTRAKRHELANNFYKISKL